MTQFSLGRTLEHDERSKQFVHPYTTVRPSNVQHVMASPPLNQGQLGSCEGNTAAEFLNSDKAIGNRQAFNKRLGLKPVPGATAVATYLDELDAQQLYGKATALDNDQIPGKWPPTDTGTSGVGIAKSLKSFGGLKQYNWTFTWTAFLAALQTQPIMLGTNWYESMFQTSRAGWVIEPVGNAKPVGGHAYLAFALDYDHQVVGCTNHWGTDWGTSIGGYHGSFWITFKLLQRLLIREQGDSLVPVLL